MIRRRAIRTFPIASAWLMLAFQPSPGWAADGDSVAPDVAAAEQRVEDAWWTGPIAASGAETLPPGYAYFEPYLFDVISKGLHSPGSQAYILYGVAPRFTAGLIPLFGRARDVRGDTRLEMGDLTFTFQYRLTAANPTKKAPSVSVVVQPHVPTAPFDQLGPKGTGLGGGTLGATIGIYGQQYVWLPNGRILRGRINVDRSIDGPASVRGTSVYGTPEDFDGRVRRGASTSIDLSAEYSLNRRLVGALEVLHGWQGVTEITARRGGAGSRRSLSASQFSAVIPSVEYSWNANQGVVVGTRFIFKRQEQPASFTPVIAFSQFF